MKCNLVKWLACLVGFTILFSCNTATRKERPYAILKIYGNNASRAGNLTRDNLLFTSNCSPASPAGLVADDADWLYLDSWVWTYHQTKDSKQGTLRFLDADSLLFVNGELRGIRLNRQYHLGPLLSNMDSLTMSQLSLLEIQDFELDSCLNWLKALANINPGISLMFEASDSANMHNTEALLSLFSPVDLSVSLAPQDFGLLAKEQQVHTLWLNVEGDSIFVSPALPKLPNLKQLRISGNDRIDSCVLTEDLLSQNQQVEMVAMHDLGTAHSTGVLNPLKQLHELTAMGVSIADSEVLAHAPTLEKILTDTDLLFTKLPNLRWITFPAKTSQQRFDNIIGSNSNLEVIEMMKPEYIVHLDSLKQLKHLTALTIVEADTTNMQPLFTMHHLKLLSVSQKNNTSDSLRRQLSTALPNTLVVANDGFCLGSGWLMLLMPALAIALIAAVKRNNRRAC